MFKRLDARDKAIEALMEENRQLRAQVSELHNRLVARSMEDILSIPQQYDEQVNTYRAEPVEPPMPNLSPVGEVM